MLQIVRLAKEKCETRQWPDEKTKVTNRALTQHLTI